MTRTFRIYYLIIFLPIWLFPNSNYGQDVKNRSGFEDCIESKILQENRNILVHLPENYDNSNKAYDVIYQLDGKPRLLRKTALTVKRLSYKEKLIPEMIIVEIVNTYRDRDMWPVNTKYYPDTNTPGAKDFLKFIEIELIPYIDISFRTTQNRIICGQSLSGVFTLYTFLTKPELFGYYLVSSGAFPDCEEYFKDLSNEAFQKPDQYDGHRIYIAHGLKDPLDSNGKTHQPMIDFSESIKENLGNMVSCKYVAYDKEGHVPKSSLYDGLIYLYNIKAEK